jgi:hypothetical protein
MGKSATDKKTKARTVQSPPLKKKAPNSRVDRDSDSSSLQKKSGNDGDGVNSSLQKKTGNDRNSVSREEWLRLFKEVEEEYEVHNQRYQRIHGMREYPFHNDVNAFIRDARDYIEKARRLRDSMLTDSVLSDEINGYNLRLEAAIRYFLRVISGIAESVKDELEDNMTDIEYNLEEFAKESDIKKILSDIEQYKISVETSIGQLISFENVLFQPELSSHIETINQIKIKYYNFIAIIENMIRDIKNNTSGPGMSTPAPSTSRTVLRRNTGTPSQAQPSDLPDVIDTTPFSPNKEKNDERPEKKDNDVHDHRNEKHVKTKVAELEQYQVTHPKIQSTLQVQPNASLKNHEYPDDSSPSSDDGTEHGDEISLRDSSSSRADGTHDGGSWMNNTIREKRMYSHENKEVVEFVRCVCNFWLNDPVTREFYKNFLQPLYKKENHSREWVRMSEEQMKQLCESKMDGTGQFENKVRFNLRRAIHGDGHILFQSCIPDIPVGTIVHYTSSDRTVKSFKVKDKRDLAYIYQLAYNHELGNYNNYTGYDYPYAHRGDRPSRDIEKYQKKREYRQQHFNSMAETAGFYNGHRGGGGFTTKLEISVSNTVLDIEVNYETRCSSPYQSWKNFNHSAWIERILMDNKKSSGQGVDLDSLLRTDIIDENSVRWMWDEKENKYYYTDKNASRVYFDHTLAKKRKNCYDTYLMNETNYNEEKCEEIMSCISADNPSGLYNCLRALSDGNADLFEAAKRDVERTGKHNPVIIKKILGAFGVPKDKAYLASGLDVPCHPRQWIKTLHKNLRERKVAEPIIRQIRSNEPLIKYVSALIILCRANHTILNKEKAGARASGNNKYQTDINGKITRPVHRFNKNDFRNKLLSAVNEDAINTFFHSALNNDWYNNSIFIPSSAVAYVHSGGGNSTHTATNGFGVVYNNIKAHLKRLGLTMHHEDDKAIEKKIKSVDTLNEQLAKCAEMLTNLVRIARAYGITINTDMPVSNIRLKNVLTVNDVNNFLRKHALRIRSYMRNNFNVQHNIYNELLGNVFPTIMDVNCDDEDNNDSDDDTRTVLFGDE